MLKKLTFLLGFLGGLAGGGIWLLSQSVRSEESGGSPVDIVKAHVQRAQERFDAALAEGKARGGVVENRLRQDLDAYRLHPDRPASS